MYQYEYIKDIDQIKINEELSDKYGLYIPTFDSVFNSHKDELFKSNDYEWFRDDRCSEVFETVCRQKYEKELKNIRYINGLYNISNVITTTEVYRSVAVPNPSQFIEELMNYVKTSLQVCELNGDKKCGIGVFWSWNERSAVTYWEDKIHKNKKIYNIKLKALINKENINTIDTIGAALEFKNDEEEIRLYKNNEIIINEIEYYDPEEEIKKKIYGNWKVYT